MVYRLSEHRCLPLPVDRRIFYWVEKRENDGEEKGQVLWSGTLCIYGWTSPCNFSFLVEQSLWLFVYSSPNCMTDSWIKASDAFCLLFINLGMCKQDHILCLCHYSGTNQSWWWSWDKLCSCSSLSLCSWKVRSSHPCASHNLQRFSLVSCEPVPVHSWTQSFCIILPAECLKLKQLLTLYQLSVGAGISGISWSLNMEAAVL